jgi:AAA domain
VKISSGIKQDPYFLLLYGVDGIGKTSFAGEAPKSIIVGPESGSNRLRVNRAEGIKTYEDLLSAVKWLREEKHDFQSVGIDSLDWIEPLIWKTCAAKAKVETIEDVGGGYGKGYGEAVSVWADFISKLKDLREARRMNVICIAHHKVTTVNDPAHPMPYDRYTLKLQDGKSSSAAALWREAVEAVLFASYEDTVFKANKNDKTAKAVDTGARKLYTIRRSFCDAKNRFGLPPELPFSKGESWATFEAAAQAGSPYAADQIYREIQPYMEHFKSSDPVFYDRMKPATDKAFAEKDITKLEAILNYAKTTKGGGS